MHPLHDIIVPSSLDDFVPVVIEIPKGSKCKYEVDKHTGMLMLDRVLYSSAHYPANYGFFPQSHADDGDPLDVLVLMQEPVHPLTIVRARPVGGIKMRDDKGEDDKIVAVAVDDPAYSHITEISQVPQHVQAELKRFFQDYKILEGKTAEVDHMYGREMALKVIAGALDAYRQRASWRKP
jgi:inorganic pyrophosphatase